MCIEYQMIMRIHSLFIFFFDNRFPHPQECQDRSAERGDLLGPRFWLHPL